MSEAAKDNGIVLFIMEGDRIAALLLWILFAITEAEDFIGWIYLAGLAVETVVIVFLIRLAKRKGWWASFILISVAVALPIFLHCR